MAPQLLPEGELLDPEMAVVAPAPPEESAFRRFRRFRKSVRKTRHPLAKQLYGGVALALVVSCVAYFGYHGAMPAMTQEVSASHGRRLSSMACTAPLAYAVEHTCTGTATAIPATCAAPTGADNADVTACAALTDSTACGAAAENCVFTAAVTHKCDLDPETDSIATCPAGCTEAGGAPSMRGGVFGVLYLLGCLYIFIGIGIVCDFFFEPSLEAISEVLALSPDVAGATFMAAGSSAPELFTSVGDTFGTGNNIGVGTILGSAMFNILIIIAVSALYAGQELDIDWLPVARDVGFYSMSVGLLVLFFLTDDWIEWWEGAVMVFGYGLYILYMVFNSKIHAMCEAKKPAVEEKKKKSLQRSMTRSMKKKEPTPEEEKSSRKFKRESSRAMVMVKMNDKNAVSKNKGQVAPAPAWDGGAPGETNPSESGASSGGEEEETESLWEWPESKAGQVLFIISVPFNAAFTITVPNCADPRFEKLYPVTFIMCIVWLAVLCAGMAQLGTAIGCIWDVDPLVMGILLLAIGTSVPDAMASMIVAKAGEGGMAIANAIGSNVFDILLGLGLPWMIYGLVPCPAIKKINPNNGVVVDTCVIFRDTSGNLYIDLAILYATVALFVVAMFFTKWKMNAVLAKILISMYVAYITFQILRAKVF